MPKSFERSGVESRDPIDQSSIKDCGYNNCEEKQNKQV